MIIATGSADFVGSNITEALNNKGVTGVLVADNLKDDTKLVNLVGLDIVDYTDKKDFPIQITAGEEFGDAEAIFYEGVCSPTTEWDGRHMMGNNYQYSKKLLYYHLKREIPFLYASSVVTYGGRISDFIESREYEKPLNICGCSKFLSDECVRQILPEVNPQIVSFCYFNVYGPREGHKGSMVSAVPHLNTQLNNGESPKLFEGSGNFKHDFVYMGDVADVSLWLLENGVSGIFNLGTSRAGSLQAVTDATFAYHKKDQIEYIPFPNKLKDCYQVFTQADLTNLRATGYDKPFKTAAEGVAGYMAWLNRDT